MAGCSNTSTTEATSQAGHEHRTSPAAQYQNINLDARYDDGILKEHESNLFWGEGERIKVLRTTGETLAYTEESDHAHPALIDHSRKMQQAIQQVDDNIYLGYGIDTPVMIEGADGIIIVDPGESVEMASVVRDEFRRITDKPVKANIYSHNHTDHISGVRAWTTDETVASGEVKIIAEEGLTAAVLVVKPWSAVWSSCVVHGCQAC